MTTPRDTPADITPPDITIDPVEALAKRVTALEARVDELLGVVTDTQPDVFEARRKLNTSDKADRPQAMADLDRAVHLRATVEEIRTAVALDLEAP